MRIRFFAPLLALLAACDDVVSSELASVGVASESSVVVRLPDSRVASVPLRVTNPLKNTVYLPSCGERTAVAVERRNGTAWENAGTSFCPAHLPQGAIPLAAGAELRFTADIVAQPGEYRVVLTVSEEFDLRIGQIVTSAPFEVR